MNLKTFEAPSNLYSDKALPWDDLKVRCSNPGRTFSVPKKLTYYWESL